MAATRVFDATVEADGRVIARHVEWDLRESPPTVESMTILELLAVIHRKLGARDDG
jgi:hypothetical protein